MYLGHARSQLEVSLEDVAIKSGVCENRPRCCAIGRSPGPRALNPGREAARQSTALPHRGAATVKRYLKFNPTLALSRHLTFNTDTLDLLLSVFDMKIEEILRKSGRE